MFLRDEFLLLLLFFFFWLSHEAWGILIPQPEIEHRPWQEQPNYWTARKFPKKWISDVVHSLKPMSNNRKIIKGQT